MENQLFDTKRFNSFSGCDIVASINAILPNGKRVIQVIGSLTTITYSLFMKRDAVRSLGNVNAKDYTYGQRTIAGSLIFTVFNQHWFHEMLVNNGISPSDMNYLMDELPPFNITISFANEYGKQAKMAIYGVRCVSEGMVLSMKDIYSENTYQYVATGIDYITENGNYGSSNKTIGSAGNNSLSNVAGDMKETETDDSIVGTKPKLQSGNVAVDNNTIVDEQALSDAQKNILNKRAKKIIDELNKKSQNL